jgi:hypothetical protein
MFKNMSIALKVSLSVDLSHEVTNLQSVYYKAQPWSELKIYVSTRSDCRSYRQSSRLQNNSYCTVQFLRRGRFKHDAP